MVELLHGLDAKRIRENLERIRERVGPDVEILAATKYVPSEELAAVRQAGVALVGENRLQDLKAKQAEWAGAFTWDFIGNLQSRKVKEVLPLVRLIHSIGSRSALAQLERHGRADSQVLIQVNVAGEEGKGGVAPSELAEFISACSASVAGLSTMPPYVENSEDSRRHFARLAELAAENGLETLSMGTSQDWEVAVEEGATIIRLGSVLYR